MAFAATIFWLLNALLLFVGTTIPLVYLVTFNLAFATYALVDLVCDALMVTYGRKTGRVGSFINFLVVRLHQSFIYPSDHPFYRIAAPGNRTTRDQN